MAGLNAAWNTLRDERLRADYDAAIGPALDRAFEAGVPYLVNVLTDPGNAYPRSSNLA